MTVMADLIEDVQFLQDMGYTTVVQLADRLGMHPRTLAVTLYKARTRGLYEGRIDATGLRQRTDPPSPPRDPLGRVPDMTPLQIERFWSHVDPTGFCWLWTGTTARGRGVARVGARRFSAPRVAWTLLVGPIPAGAELAVLCRVWACVNPDHLLPARQGRTARLAVAS